MSPALTTADSFTSQKLLFLNVSPLPDQFAFQDLKHILVSKLPAPHPIITRTKRGILLTFPTATSRWAATDSSVLLNSLAPSYRLTISERRSAIVLTNVQIRDLNWMSLAVNDAAHKELHPSCFAYLQDLNQIWVGGVRVEYRIRKIERLAFGREGDKVAVWLHDEEIAEWFLRQGRWWFGEAGWVELERKRGGECEVCGRRGHATRNCWRAFGERSGNQQARQEQDVKSEGNKN